MSEEIVESLSTNLRNISVESVECKKESCKGASRFDETIGYIEDILLEDEFQQLQHKFLERYWQFFEPVEENKLIYMDIFQEYNNAIESYIDGRLTKRMPSFSMETFLNQLSESSETDGEVFEVLSTFTDFIAFKEMFLDYRAVKEGKVQDLSAGISITSAKSSNDRNEAKELL